MIQSHSKTDKIISYPFVTDLNCVLFVQVTGLASHFSVDVGDGSAGVVRHSVTINVVGSEPSLLQVNDVGAGEHHEK